MLFNDVKEKLEEMFGDSREFPDEFIVEVIDRVTYTSDFPNYNSDDIRICISNTLKEILENYYV